MRASFVADPGAEPFPVLMEAGTVVDNWSTYARAAEAAALDHGAEQLLRVARHARYNLDMIRLSIEIRSPEYVLAVGTDWGYMHIQAIATIIFESAVIHGEWSDLAVILVVQGNPETRHGSEAEVELVHRIAAWAANNGFLAAVIPDSNAGRTATYEGIGFRLDDLGKYMVPGEGLSWGRRAPRSWGQKAPRRYQLLELSY